MQAEHLECILLQFSFSQIGTFFVFRDFYFIYSLLSNNNLHERVFIFTKYIYSLNILFIMSRTQMIWLAGLSPQWWQSLTTEWTSSIGRWTMCSSLLFWWLPLIPRLLHTSARMMEGSCRLLWHHCFWGETDSFSNTVKKDWHHLIPTKYIFIYQNSFFLSET